MYTRLHAVVKLLGKRVLLRFFVSLIVLVSLFIANVVVMYMPELLVCECHVCLEWFAAAMALLMCLLALRFVVVNRVVGG